MFDSPAKTKGLIGCSFSVGVFEPLAARGGRSHADEKIRKMRNDDKGRQEEEQQTADESRRPTSGQGEEASHRPAHV